MADKAAKRKPRMHLLPYGIPLCLGFVSYLIYLHGPVSESPGLAAAWLAAQQSHCGRQAAVRLRYFPTPPADSAGPLQPTKLKLPVPA